MVTVTNLALSSSLEPVPELWRDWHQHKEPDGGFPKEKAKGTAEAGVHLRHEGQAGLSLFTDTSLKVLLHEL